MDKIEDTFVCQICTEHMTLQIHQCMQGHLICISCLKTILGNNRPSCPTCRIPFHSIDDAPRNRALEKLRGAILVTHVDKGCNERALKNKMALHPLILQVEGQPDVTIPLDVTSDTVFHDVSSEESKSIASLKQKLTTKKRKLHDQMQHVRKALRENKEALTCLQNTCTHPKAFYSVERHTGPYGGKTKSCSLCGWEDYTD